MNNKLKEIRMKKGLSQFALAKLSDISPSDISKIESGALRAYPGWQKRLADALGVSKSELFPEVCEKCAK